MASNNLYDPQNSLYGQTKKKEPQAQPAQPSIASTITSAVTTGLKGFASAQAKTASNDALKAAEEAKTRAAQPITVKPTLYQR